MKRVLAGLLAFSLVTASGLAAAQSCRVEVAVQAVDQTDPNCFPRLDEAKCQHFAKGSGVIVGVTQKDIDEAKKDGMKVVNFANQKVCEGKKNCGPYVVEVASVAKCEGKVDQVLPGGEYRGLTASAARQVAHFANKVGEDGALKAENRGKVKGAKKPGRLWGND